MKIQKSFVISLVVLLAIVGWDLVTIAVTGNLSHTFAQQFCWMGVKLTQSSGGFGEGLGLALYGLTITGLARR